MGMYTRLIQTEVIVSHMMSQESLKELMEYVIIQKRNYTDGWMLRTVQATTLQRGKDITRKQALGSYRESSFFSG